MLLKVNVWSWLGVSWEGFRLGNKFPGIGCPQAIYSQL